MKKEIYFKYNKLNHFPTRDPAETGQHGEPGHDPERPALERPEPEGRQRMHHAYVIIYKYINKCIVIIIIALK